MIFLKEFIKSNDLIKSENKIWKKIKYMRIHLELFNIVFFLNIYITNHDTS